MGVPVFIGRSWIFVALVITALFGPTVANVTPAIGFGAYAIAAFFAVLLLISVLVHEAAHAVTARRCGFTVQRIVADFWGGHTAYHGEQTKPGAAAAVAFAGPLANAALAGVGWLVLESVESPIVGLLLIAFTYANAFVAIFNLLPGLPLDGGFLLEALVWKATGSRGTGTLAAGWVGRGLVVALGVYAILLPLSNGRPPGLYQLIWVVLIGGFLWSGATQAVRSGRSRRRFEAITLASVWRPVTSVLASTSVDSVPWNQASLWLVTDERGEPIGIVDPAALAAVPAGGRASTPVSAICVRQPPGWVVPGQGNDTALAVVASMQSLESPLVAIRTPNGQVSAVIFANDL